MIKKILSLFIISVYSLLIFKNFIPKLIYQVNLDYIIKNLCEQKDEAENLCMGHCYLNKKVKEETEETDKSTPANLIIKNLEIHFVSQKNFEIDSKNIQTTKQHFYCIIHSTLSNNKKPLLPPPKFIIS